VELFAAADVMALPSWKDPNPLTVIEGLWAGLPMIISKYCGNSPEAVEEGRNGWLIEPADHAQIRAVFREVLAMPLTRLAEFGAASLRIAARFDTDSAVRRFVDQLDHC
jgi:glycosyltransferase involved in cell wall biosynthesis